MSYEFPQRSVIANDRRECGNLIINGIASYLAMTGKRSVIANAVKQSVGRTRNDEHDCRYANRLLRLRASASQ